MDAVLDRIKAGESLNEAIEESPAVYVKFHRGLVAFQQTMVKDRCEPTKVVWCWGPTGSGKSRYVHETAPAAYWKDTHTKWWDGYNQQENVVLDDYRPNKELSVAYMLRLMDRYPLSVESKGGYLKFNSQTIYITAPCDPTTMYHRLEWLGEEDIGQILRRITEIKEFPLVNAGEDRPVNNPQPDIRFANANQANET